MKWVYVESPFTHTKLTVTLLLHITPHSHTYLPKWHYLTWLKEGSSCWKKLTVHCVECFCSFREWYLHLRLGSNFTSVHAYVSMIVWIQPIWSDILYIFEPWMNILKILQRLILCSITRSLGEAWHWSSSADILSADSQHGPSGWQWHQPVSGGYPGLHLWNSSPKNWRQGGWKRLPDVCHWLAVWYVQEWKCLKADSAKLSDLSFLHAASTINIILLIWPL